VVEDEVGVAELIAEALTRSSYDARVALTAADALVIAEMDRPDAISSWISISPTHQKRRRSIACASCSVVRV
jgi:DNA-binding NtrC family response regulator